MRSHRLAPSLAALVLITASSFAIAQQPPTPSRVRGTIEAVDGDVLSVKSRNGEDVKLRMTADVLVVGIIKIALSDIKVGSFVGATTVPGPDGGNNAVEVHVFPEAMRGTGEGHRPWDLMPNSTMTNATVDSEVAISDGQKLILKYKDGEKTFVVPANVVVVAFAPGSAADLKAGEKVFVAAAAKQPDGTLTAARINVGRNGVTPPM